jgi:hypothetical protein
MKAIRAGEISMQYDHGFIRYISYGNEEIIRRIYFALRDENWATYESHIEDEQANISDNHFHIQYTCSHQRDGEVIFRWRVEIQGDTNGLIRFTIDGEALQTILKNRAGFCVLHPVTTKGQTVEIAHVDGTTTASSFPVHIDPANPFKNISAMQWLEGNHWFRLEFEGDVFETEDQRNWSDGSFKTFCTPSDLPIPVKLERGTRIRQKITFYPTQPLPSVAAPASVIQIHLTGTQVSLPLIGTQLSSEIPNYTQEVIDTTQKLNLSYIRTDVYPGAEDWIKKFSNDCVYASKFNLPVAAALHVTKHFGEEIETFIQLCQQNRLNLHSIVVFSDEQQVTSQDVIAFTSTIKERMPLVKVGGGTDYNFTEINRNRREAGNLDFISFSLHPQEHSFDDASVIENIEAQSDTVASARAIYPGKAIYISPVTLKKRFNPYATDATKRVMPEAQRVDPRQKTSFAAVFTLGSIKRLVESGVSSITLYQVAGQQGLMDENGNPYPVYFALKDVLSLRQCPVQCTISSSPLVVDALCFLKEEKKQWIIFNYTEENQDVKLPDGTALALSPREIRLYHES